MKRFCIRMTLSEPIPGKMNGKPLQYQGTTVHVSAGTVPPSLEIGPLAADSHCGAAVAARGALNTLLNYFAAMVQFRGTLAPGYEYWDLDTPTERGIVVVAEPAVAYARSIIPPDGFSLDVDLSAAAFLRRGDSSLDVFDQFRNYYLAVDAVGKGLRTGGKDSTLITDTLHLVTTPDVIDALDRNVQALPALASAAASTPAERINNALYKGYRCALMHSGNSTDFTPFDPIDEVAVADALSAMRGVAWQYVKHQRASMV